MFPQFKIKNSKFKVPLGCDNSSKTGAHGPSRCVRAHPCADHAALPIRGGSSRQLDADREGKIAGWPKVMREGNCVALGSATGRLGRNQKPLPVDCGSALI